jgi:hypothetical protein
VRLPLGGAPTSASSQPSFVPVLEQEQAAIMIDIDDEVASHRLRPAPDASAAARELTRPGMSRDADQTMVPGGAWSAGPDRGARELVERCGSGWAR